MTRLAETTAASPLPVTVVKGLKLVAALGATGVIFRMKRERERERERERRWIGFRRSDQAFWAMVSDQSSGLQIL
ncbi:MAG: hypothetical protein D6691_02925 [Candidatus Hydrogenedentota bacterium]|nr:MAG: hypothetical protein D6691_02925 [Candidatus Hydrogenedentota bacterium]